MRTRWALTGTIAVLGTVFLAACAPETAEEPPAEEAAGTEGETTTAQAAQDGALDALRSAYAQHFNLGHPSMVAELYTEDAVLMASNSPAAVGRAAIEAQLTQQMEVGSPQITITAEETKVMGDWAVDRGTYSLEITPEGGEAMTETGYYVVLARRVAEGDWKLQWAIGNSDSPAPGTGT